MLSKRFKNDGKPILRLNELQWQMKNQIKEKVAEGIYSFEEVPCCVCGGKNFELLSQKDRYGLHFPVVICRDCGLVQANPRWTQYAYNRFYEIEYQRLHIGKDVPTDEFFKSQYQRGAQIYDYLSQSLGIGLVKLFVVEVGCGTGGILQYFKEKGNEVYGVDLDPQIIEFGKDNYALNIEVGTIDEVVKLDKSPDIVIYSHVLEHILDPVAEFTKLRSSMTNDSLLYIEVPGVNNFRKLKGYYGDLLRFLTIPHVYYFTITTLKNVLSKAGYDFICGDEVIHSIFRKSSLPKNTDFHYDSDYQSTIAFLRKLEFTRLLPSSYKLEAYFMRVAPKLLKAVGLYNFARSFYHRIR